MLKNDKQYNITKARLRNFEEALKETENSIMEPLRKKLHVSAIQSQINDFQREINEYEILKYRELESVTIHSISELPTALIKARIYRGLSQLELAKKLDLKEQQIQRYESCEYSTASISRINEVASALNIKIEDVKLILKESSIEIPAGADPLVAQRIFQRRSLMVF